MSNKNLTIFECLKLNYPRAQLMDSSHLLVIVIDPRQTADPTHVLTHVKTSASF